MKKYYIFFIFFLIGGLYFFYPSDKIPHKILIKYNDVLKNFPARNVTLMKCDFGGKIYYRLLSESPGSSWGEEYFDGKGSLLSYYSVGRRDTAFYANDRDRFSGKQPDNLYKWICKTIYHRDEIEGAMPEID